jgi:TRAP-type C4-dicarboxylate transport system permease small subunit
VDFLYERTRGRVRLVWNVFTHILILCVLVLMAIYGWQFAIVQNAASTYALHLPTSLYSIPLVIASFSMILTFVLRVHEFIEEYRRTA